MSPKTPAHESAITWLVRRALRGLDLDRFELGVGAPLSIGDSEPEPDLIVIDAGRRSHITRRPLRSSSRSRSRRSGATSAPSHRYTPAPAFPCTGSSTSTAGARSRTPSRASTAITRRVEIVDELIAAHIGLAPIAVADVLAAAARRAARSPRRRRSARSRTARPCRARRGRARWPSGGTRPPWRVGLRAEHAGGDDQRGGRGDVRRGHARADVALRVAEPAGSLRVNASCRIERPGGSFGRHAGWPGSARVLAAAGRDEVQARAGVGVLGQAAVLGDRADGHDAGQRRRIGDAVEGDVARGGDDQRALAPRVPDRGGDPRDLRRRTWSRSRTRSSG